MFFFPQVVFSKYTDLLPKEVLHDDAPELQKPDEEAVKEVRYLAPISSETQIQPEFIEFKMHKTIGNPCSYLYLSSLRRRIKPEQKAETVTRR